MRVLSSNEHKFLSQLSTANKVPRALKGMFPTKSPSPDGFHAVFYQKFWDVVGDDVLKMVLGFLNGSVDISSLNETFLVLIPKAKAPTNY